MKGKARGFGFYIIVLIILLGTASTLLLQDHSDAPIYSDVIRYFEEEQVKDFVIDNGTLILTLREVQDGKNVQVTYPLASLDLFIYDLGDLIKEQRASGVLESEELIIQTTPWWMSMLPSLVLIVIVALFWYFMMSRADGGAGKALSFGKSRAKMVTDTGKKVTFANVAGADEEKGELQEIVEFLKNPKRFMVIGARIPKGVLLVGPPGTGKTLIARAVAGEAGVPFFTISGSDFVELYVGVGASRVRDLFEQAKKNAPAIIFIDEIDAVGRHRGAGLGGGHDEREQTLNQLLVEMDGFGANEGVIIIAATNRPDILDPALLRPGRFDRQVYVGLPDIKGREAILKVHAQGKPFEDGVSFEAISKSTAGFTGADLENLLNEAALLAARRGKEKIGNEDLDDAFLKVIMGTEKRSRKISDKERRLTAYHEAGHALVTRLLPSQDPVHQISIIPRGRAGGFTLSLPQEDKSYMAKSEMLDTLVVLLGGRVAEKLVLNDISTGASNDIERASELTRKMVTKYGMSDKLGPITFGSGHEEVFLGRDFGTAKNYSENVAAAIDEEVQAIIGHAYDTCEAMLKAHMDILHALASFLLEHETMDGHEFECIFNGGTPEPRAKHAGVITTNTEKVQDSGESTPADQAPDASTEPNGGESQSADPEAGQPDGHDSGEA